MAFNDVEQVKSHL